MFPLMAVRLVSVAVILFFVAKLMSLPAVNAVALPVVIFSVALSDISPVELIVDLSSTLIF